MNHLPLSNPKSRSNHAGLSLRVVFVCCLAYIQLYPAVPICPGVPSIPSVFEIRCQCSAPHAIHSSLFEVFFRLQGMFSARDRNTPSHAVVNKFSAACSGVKGLPWYAGKDIRSSSYPPERVDMSPPPTLHIGDAEYVPSEVTLHGHWATQRLLSIVIPTYRPTRLAKFYVSASCCI